MRKLLPALLGLPAAFAAGFIILAAQGYDAPLSFTSLFHYSVFSRFAFFGTLARSVPLILTGLSAAAAFSSGCVNLGQPGQLILGALAAAALGLAVDLPALLMIPLLLLAAMAAGGLWAFIAGWFRHRFAMDEFISTLMLNFAADYFALYLISGPLLDRDMFSPMTKAIHSGGFLPLPGGFPTAVAVVLLVFCLVWIFFHRTKTGYELKIMGTSRLFARTGGCRTDADFLTVIIISGALAGLAGGLLIMGGQQHRFLKGLGANYAWDGVMIAIVADNGLTAVLLYGLFFAMLQTGSMGMEMETAVPSEFVLVFQAIIVLFAAASRKSFGVIMNWITVRRKAGKTARGEAHDT
ncbi:MAG: ABC transporter permease [Spirochaeta sp. LUC14_002_19_P3]|nr:MAG: ABC transporter permease [Spirochaeta sp. LUC14_002_19_P3]